MPKHLRITDKDGHLTYEVPVVTEKITGLLFDISASPNFLDAPTGADEATVDKYAELKEKLNGKIFSINNASEVNEANLPGFKDILGGIPYYHINHFFSEDKEGGSVLWVAFADCSKGWNALIKMQNQAYGRINQFGIWTEQKLWSNGEDKYKLNLVTDINDIMKSMANDYQAPAVVVLNANTSVIDKVLNADGKTFTTSPTVELTKIPVCNNGDSRYVAIALGQACDDEVHAMQIALASTTPVGNVGAVLGSLVAAGVHVNVGSRAHHNVGDKFPSIEMGFGANTADKKLADTTPYTEMTFSELDMLAELGYIFLEKEPGQPNYTFFNNDTTCSDGDYRTIARNRVMNKVRRNIRLALLPYVNAPLAINPTNGQLSTATIATIKGSVDAVLSAMATAQEISGYSINIPLTQNVLKTDTLIVSYSVVPNACANVIDVTEGYALKV